MRYSSNRVVTKSSKVFLFYPNGYGVGLSVNRSVTDGKKSPGLLARWVWAEVAKRGQSEAWAEDLNLRVRG